MADPSEELAFIAMWAAAVIRRRSHFTASVDEHRCDANQALSKIANDHSGRGPLASPSPSSTSIPDVDRGAARARAASGVNTAARGGAVRLCVSQNNALSNMHGMTVVV